MSLADRSPDKSSGSTFSVRKVAIMAIFIAISAVGSLIKIPSPLGSVALDSAPGFFAGIAFGGWVGFIVIAIGHLLTSAIVGFPLTLPLQIGIAIGMGLCVLVFRWLGRQGKAMLVVAVIVTSLLNSFALGLLVLPIGGWGMYAAAVPSLLIGAAVNTIIAAIAYFAVRNSKLLD